MRTWEAISRFAQRRPFVFATGFTAMKAAAADAMVQVVFERRSEFSLRRNLVFASFGGLYQGAFQYMVLVGAFRRIFPTVEKFAKLPLRQKVRDGRGLAEVFAQVGVTNFVMDPFFCLPSFYLCKEVASWLDKRGLPQDSGQGLQRDLDEDVAPSPRVGGEIGEGRGEEGGKGLPMYARVMKSWYRNVREDMVASWSIWIPAQTLNFSLVALHLRVPFIGCISFIYTAVLSRMRGADDDP